MDDEEYNRLIDKKKQQVRFAKTVRNPANRNDRRLTIFNPIDPNNA